MLEMFEGVCLTTVILTPGACGGRLRAAAHDIDSAAPAAPAAAAECSEIVHFPCFLQHAVTFCYILETLGPLGV